MTRRLGRTRAGVLWLGVVLTLLGGASACGDDDGEDSPNGTAGASTGGTKSGSGGSSGTGGSKVSGGSSGAAPKGGSGGSSGSGASGAGGTPPIAGEGGVPAEGGGGVGPTAGSAGSGIGGDAGSGAVSGSPSAGEGGTGQPGTGGSPSGGSDAGAGGGAAVSVEYRSCEKGAAITRIEIYRIDRALETCTLVVIQQGQINCLDGLQNGGWCVVGAALSADVGACESFQTPSDLVQATAGDGTFTVFVQPLSLDIDVDFDFPDSGDLPQSVSMEATNCLADCLMNDCRP